MVTNEQVDLDRMRHSAAHVMAEAVLSIFPQAKFAIGPTIEDGFYYDFDLPRPLTPDDLSTIEAKMCEIIEADVPFENDHVGKDTARTMFAQQPYKLELIEDIAEPNVGIYHQGSFTDLCRGPHVQRTGQIGPVKLLSIAGAYWRGDEHRPMLQRIYGTAWHTKAELDAYLQKLEEAGRRDHRRLGRELDLYSVDESVGAGLILWHPKGALVRQLIEDFWRAEHRRRGYDIVFSPHIGRAQLWDISGHLQSYKENMFGAMEVEEQEYILKPMNCPFHISMYKTHLRSYRELPLRWAELGTVYRYERSGVLHGLTRVRGFTQDDAHIFCRPDQLESEITGVLDLALFMLRSFGFQNFAIDLSVRDPQNKEKYLGSDEVWENAEAALEAALKAKGLSYHRAEGEAVFYGPKIDIKLIDALGRGWQGPTTQVDFNLPERFDVNYVGADGQEHRAVMVHRTVLGSMERFMGCLIEQYAGAFPVWLAPVQAVVIPIADRHLAYASSIAAELQTAGLRAAVDGRAERMANKIREAQLQKIPYMLVVGDKEAESGAVSVRLRSNENLGAQPVSEFVALATAAVAAKT